jgi:hypothetical protein
MFTRGIAGVLGLSVICYSGQNTTFVNLDLFSSLHGKGGGVTSQCEHETGSVLFSLI